MFRIYPVFTVAILTCLTAYLIVGSHVDSLRGSLRQESKSNNPTAASEELEIQIRKDNDKAARNEVKPLRKLIKRFDAFEHFHGYRGKQGMQNCAACHRGGKNGGENGGLQKSFDNYLFFHGTPGNKVLNKCSSCHVKSVMPFKIRRQTP
jgi:hypothetical protein